MFFTAAALAGGKDHKHQASKSIFSNREYLSEQSSTTISGTSSRPTNSTCSRFCGSKFWMPKIASPFLAKKGVITFLPHSRTGCLSYLVAKSPLRIRRIRADNRYKSGKFINFCASLGLEVIINEPYTPEQNGKIERFHKTIKREFFWKYCSFQDSDAQLQLKLNFWLNYYNSKRRHYGYGMNGLTPDLKIAATLFNSLKLNFNKGCQSHFW